LASDTTEARRRGDDPETHASPRLSASASDAPNSESATRDDRAHQIDRVMTDERSSLTERDGERLTRFLIGKSFVETLFLVALVAAFSYAHFNPRLRGTLDAANEREVLGWVVDEADPNERVEVELYIDGHFVARRRAGEPRPDVLAAGRAANADHGYAFETPTLPARETEYEASVFAAHEGIDRQLIGLRMVGKPLRFRVQAGPKNVGAPENWWEGLEH
jgi:hypothetical protein